MLVKIDEQVNGKKVVVEMKGKLDFPQCGFSAHTVEILQPYGYPFETVDVLEDTALRKGIKQYSTWPTSAQVFIKEKFIGGCNILHEMHERSELAPLLKAAFLEP